MKSEPDVLFFSLEKMKRKRGNKKGKSKRPAALGANEEFAGAVTVDTEDNSGLDDYDHAESPPKMDVDTPSSTGTDQPNNIENVNPDRPSSKPIMTAVYGRVKVKLKTYKGLESQLTSSDAPTQSDTDKSSQLLGLEKQVVVTEKTEDSANSLPETNIVLPEIPSKKTGGIKIKSRGLGSSSVNQSSINTVQGQNELSHQEPKLPHQTPRYNKQELNAALEVIKKIMKMDAAEPFNAPVNPIALGIPDYFEVIDTPMDFGTVCTNLEKGNKYTNSEDVFKDVQYIWQNCYKYNNKGDYIVDLMKRVKKNFMKYWTAAGLYCEQAAKISGVESDGGKDIISASQGKAKGSQAKHKSKKHHGKRHKDDCLCAICIMKRRRREREEKARVLKEQMRATEKSMAQSRQEETSYVDSPGGGDAASSDMDNSDEDPDSEGKGEYMKLETIEKQFNSRKEGKEENEIEIHKKSEGETSSERSQHFSGRSEDERNPQPDSQLVESPPGNKGNAKSDEMPAQREEVTEQQKRKDLQDKKRQKAKVYEDYLRFENPMLLELCGTLFPENPKSLWAGSHSLFQRQPSSRSSSIHEAIGTFMK